MHSLSDQIRRRAAHRGLTQTRLAAMLHRSPARLSELLRSLDTRRPMHDRLALLGDVAEALRMDLMLVPREKAEALQALLGAESGERVGLAGAAPRSMFDDLFIDLSEDDDERDGPRPARSSR